MFPLNNQHKNGSNHLEMKEKVSSCANSTEASFATKIS